MIDRKAYEERWPQDLLTAKEAGQILRCSHQSIRNMCAMGRLPYIKIGRTGIRVLRSGILDYLEGANGSSSQEP